MIRESVARRISYLEEDPRPSSRLAPVHEPGCGYRHLPGQPCPTPVVAPPGLEGAEYRRNPWPQTHAMALQGGQKARSRAAETRSAREAAGLAMRPLRGPRAPVGNQTARLRLCPACRRWISVPVGNNSSKDKWRCGECRFKRQQSGLRVVSRTRKIVSTTP